MLVLLLDIFENEKIKKYYIINFYKNVISISFNKKFIENYNESFKDNIKIVFIRLKLKNIIKKLKYGNKVSYIFSKIFEKKVNFKSLVLKRVLNVFDSFYEINAKNLIFETIDKHLENYIEQNNIKKECVKILYIVNDLNSSIYNNILNNINKYKYLDICYLENKNANYYNKLKEKINLINNEIGSSISFVNMEFNLEYNVYFNFTYEDVKAKYMIKKPNLFIDCLDYQSDNLNRYNLLFIKYLYDINKIFTQLELKIEKFDKTKIGVLISTKCLDFKEE